MAAVTFAEISEGRAKEVVEGAKKERNFSLEQAQALPMDPDKYGAIMSLSQGGAEAIIQAARDKVFTCVDIATAFLKKAAEAHQETKDHSSINAVTELLCKEAIEQAKRLDNNHEARKDGILFGLPISIKEHTGYKGKKCNAGFVCFMDEEAMDKSPHVNVALHAQGGIILARTIQPQTMMMLETQSKIFGTTLNPHNKNFSPGGSSGGEGALIGAGASLLGIGSDIGGSVRSPAANNGIYSFKPTAGMISTVGGRKFGYKNPKRVGVEGTRGPLSSSRKALSLFMEAYLQWQNSHIKEHPEVGKNMPAPRKWDMKRAESELSGQKTIKIGIMDWDGVVVPHPPVLRALREVRKSLSHYSPDGKFEIVDWKPQDVGLDHHQTWDLTRRLYWPDGGQMVKKHLKDGKEDLLPLVKWLFEGIEERALEPDEWKKLTDTRDTFRRTYAQRWDAAHLDAIICPVGPGTALPHDTAKYWSYTSVWNLLDYPAAVFPVTKADKSQDTWEKQEEEKKKINSSGSKDPRQNKDNRNLYNNDPAAYHGLPVGLQLVTRTGQDEKCLALLEMVEEKMGKSGGLAILAPRAYQQHSAA